jgi:hypothetical protein
METLRKGTHDNPFARRRHNALAAPRQGAE